MADKQPAPAKSGSSFLTQLALIAILWGVWFGWVQPTFFPPPPPPIPDVAQFEDGFEDDGPAADAAALADAPDPDEPVGVLPEHPRAEVELGGLDTQTGYFQRVTLTTTGAAVAAVELNDDRYRELTDRDRPLRVVGSGTPARKTLETTVDALDRQLQLAGGVAADADSATLDWEVTAREPDPDEPKLLRSVTFSLAAPDGSLAVDKKYTLHRGDPAGRDEDPRGYLLDLDVTVRNTGGVARTVRVGVLGPVGVPIDEPEHARKYRDLELAFIEPDGDLDHETIYGTAATERYDDAERARKTDAVSIAADRAADRAARRLDDLLARNRETPGGVPAGDIEAAKQKLADVEQAAAAAADAAVDAAGAAGAWTQPIYYVGTESQYFAALLFPRRGDVPANGDDPAAGLGQNPAAAFVASADPLVVDRPDADREELNDVGVELTTVPLELAPGAERAVGFTLFAGPKRRALLDPLDADVLDLGWFWFVARPMLGFLRFFHGLGLPYWAAIVCLTVTVRMCMFPLSRKAAISAARQKELAPKLKALKEKYKDDMEKLGPAQWQLMKENGANPLTGCLPMFLQLPIFIGLYNALNNSVDLRMAEFLWIDNLAAPDHLYALPFSIPFLGSWFNLLPPITVGLWYFQQKLFMPVATSPEQELQYKMMSYMTLVFGAFIYHVPAGLCLYFIASSTWTLCERKLLDKYRNVPVSDEPVDPASLPDVPARRSRAKAVTAAGPKSEEDKPQGFVGRLLANAAAAAEEARLDAQTNARNKSRGTNGKPAGGNSPGGKKSGGKRRKKSRR